MHAFKFSLLASDGLETKRNELDALENPTEGIKTHTCKLRKDDHTSSLAADIIPPDPGTGKATLQ